MAFGGYNEHKVCYIYRFTSITDKKHSIFREDVARYDADHGHLLPPLKVGDAVEDVPKINVGTPKDSKTPRLSFIAQPITEGILTLGFISAVFTGFLLANALHSSVSTQSFAFSDKTLILSHSFRVHEASAVKAKEVLADVLYDYFYGFLP